MGRYIRPGSAYNHSCKAEVNHCCTLVAPKTPTYTTPVNIGCTTSTIRPPCTLHTSRTCRIPKCTTKEHHSFVFWGFFHHLQRPKQQQAQPPPLVILFYQKFTDLTWIDYQSCGYSHVCTVAHAGPRSIHTKWTVLYQAMYP